jgi:hypothetical protein
MSLDNEHTLPFLYPELDEAVSGSFRLVTLHPGTLNEPVRCDLTRDTWQREGIEYEALSYAWGSAIAKQPIQLGRQPFLVTANLHSALSYLRYRDISRILWIDAICINQDSVKERNHQVQFMGEIYRESKRVVVWLGDSDDDSDNAVFFINSLLDVVGSSRIWTTKKLLTNPTVISFLEPQFMHLWQSVCRLLQREWWQRAWVVQEFLVGRKVVFQIGSKKLDLEPLTLFVLFIQFARSKWPSLDFQVAFASGALIDAEELIRTKGEASSPRDFLAMLKVQRHKNCLNPLDKVFSVLSLVHRPYPEVFTPDYSKSVQWMFAMVVKTYVEAHKDLNILLENMPLRASNSCPSWCPDWTVAQSRSILSSNIRSDKPARTRFSEDMRTVFIDGSTLIDVVALVHLQLSDEEFEWKYDDGIPVCNWDLEAAGRNLESKNSVVAFAKRETESTVDENFLHTIVAGNLPPEFTGGKKIGRLLEGQKKAAYFQRVRNQTWGRTVVLCKNGLLGLGPHETQKDDLVFLIEGCSMPVILRKRGGGSHFWVGDSYFRGIKRSWGNGPSPEIMIQ